MCILFLGQIINKIITWGNIEYLWFKLVATNLHTHSHEYQNQYCYGAECTTDYT